MNNSDRPTRVRHGVIAAASLMSLLLYLDRICISFAEQYVQEDLSLSNAQVGWVLSAFFVTYALGQVPAGWLTDRFGSRIMLTAYVLMWSLFTGLTGGVSAFAALLVLRLGFGFSQAGAYPTASSIVSKWVPFHRRGTASGFIALGGRVGGFLALFASGHMIVWLTPADIEIALQPSDLLNAPRLCFELSETPERETSYAETSGPVTTDAVTMGAETTGAETPTSRLRRKCFEHFTAEHREIVKRHGAAYAAALSQQQRKKRGEQSERVVAAFPPADASMLVDELNALIHSRGFFVAEDINGVSVEREAARLMRRSPTNLTDQQAGRLNRLVIEGLFPNGVKKLYVAGWRPMMVVYGSLGIVVAALIWWSCHTTPDEHPQANAAEVALIRGDRPGGQSHDGKVAGVPLGPLMRSMSMWCSCLSQWFTNIGWVFLITWAPRYLANVHHVPTEQRALLVSIPPLVGWMGMLSGGSMTDFAVRRLGLRWGRVLPISLSRWVAMFAYLGCLFEPNALLAVALFSVVAFATDFGTPSAWAFTQDVGGRYVGSVLGWGNMWGNLGAAVTPPLLIWIVGETANWDNAFLTCAGAFLLAGFFSLGINATIPIVPEDGGDADKPAIIPHRGSGTARR